MQIGEVPFGVIDWDSLPVTEHPGETGVAKWRTVELGNVRLRKVEYSPGYLADHWCSRGHVLLILSGAMTTELQDGRTFQMVAGSTYVVGENGEPHRSATMTGAKLFIVD